VGPVNTALLVQWTPLLSYIIEVGFSGVSLFHHIRVGETIGQGGCSSGSACDIADIRYGILNSISDSHQSVNIRIRTTETIDLSIEIPDTLAIMFCYPAKVLPR
jgi:hypothetical protein